MSPQGWLPLLLFVFLTGAVFYQPWLISFSVAVAVVMGVAALWQRYSLRSVSYLRKWRFRRGFPGETITVKMEIENKKLLPLSWLQITDPWPYAIAPENKAVLSTSHIPDMGNLVHLLSLRWNERATRQFNIRLNQRGVFAVGPAQLESGDLFGMYKQTQEQPQPDYITVFPELLAPSALSLPADDPFGDRRARRKMYEDPNLPMGVRAYHPEDEFRRIHWPATARTGDLQVKVYQPVTARVLEICLNVSTFEVPWLGVKPAILEQLVKMAATFCYHGFQNGYAVGLLSNGCLAHADHPFRIQPGRSHGQLPLLLSSLAAVTPFTTAPFESHLIKSLPQIPYGATLVVLTSIVPPALSDTLIHLKRYRAYTTLISIDNTPPPQLPGIRTIHLPFQEDQ